MNRTKCIEHMLPLASAVNILSKWDLHAAVILAYTSISCILSSIKYSKSKLIQLTTPPFIGSSPFSKTTKSGLNFKQQQTG